MESGEPQILEKHDRLRDEEEEFVSSLVQKLNMMPMDQRIEVVANAIEKLGREECMKAIVATFGPDAVSKPTQKPSQHD